MQIRLAYYKPQILFSALGMIWAVSSWALSKLWGYGFLQGTGPVAVIMLFLTIYDRWLWKYPILNVMNTIPNLNGFYSGEIDFHWNGQDLRKTCNLEIKQTCSNIKIKAIFDKEGENNTQSVNTEAFIKTDEAGDQYLYYYYQNRGSCKSGDSLYQHDGMNVLEIQKKKGNTTLKGYYFTNRNPQTKGCMEVSKIKGEK